MVANKADEALAEIRPAPPTIRRKDGDIPQRPAEVAEVADELITQARCQGGRAWVYLYDSYGRVSEVHRYVNATTEDINQLTRHYYDGAVVDAGYSDNYHGRVSAVQYGAFANT